MKTSENIMIGTFFAGICILIISLYIEDVFFMGVGTFLSFYSSLIFVGLQVYDYFKGFGFTLEERALNSHKPKCKN